MAETRIVVETACEHGTIESDCYQDSYGCPGGSRRPLEPDGIEAIARAVFEIEANGRWDNTTEALRTVYRASIRKCLDALAASGEDG